VFAERSQVADRSATSPVHQGGFLGLPTSGQQVRAEGIVIFRFDADRVAELWYQANDLQIAAQPG